MSSRNGASAVLVYHRVAATEVDPHGLAVHPSRFADQLHAVAQLADVVPLAGVLERHRDRRVAITFDDGYEDNLTAALPALRAMNMPATVFVTTGAMGTGELWWDRVEDLVLHGRCPTGRIEVRLADRELLVDVRTPDGRRRAVKALSRRLRVLPPDAIDAAIGRLEVQLEPVGACERHRMLTVEQLRLLAADGLVDIGAHGRRHANLGVLDAAGQRDEIEGSRDDLRAWLGEPPHAFAYPFGMAGSFDRRTEQLVRRSGYDMACANVPGRPHARDRYRLPRHIVGDWDGAELAERLTGWLS